MRRRSRSEFHEPSLVPLADMLSNTVGIMVFILIFTVLTAGGALVRMRLPVERKTDAKRAIFICYGKRVMPLDEEGMNDRFAKWLKRQIANGCRGQTLVDRVNNYRDEDSYIIQTAKLLMLLDIVSLELKCEPKASAGEDLAHLDSADSGFRRFLGSHDRRKRFIYFIVYADSQDIYRKARDVAYEAHYAVGWCPQKDPKIVFNVFNGGSSGGGGGDDGDDRREGREPVPQ